MNYLLELLRILFYAAIALVVFVIAWFCVMIRLLWDFEKQPHKR